MKQEIRVYEGPAAWRAEEFQSSDWIDVLTPTQKQELIDAARALSDDDRQWLKMTREDLVLPTLGPRLDQVTKDLGEGRGFAVLRGIDLPPMDVDYAYRVNWVLALGLGNVIAQNTNGEVIGAVQAVVDASDNGMDTRGYVSSAVCAFTVTAAMSPVFSACGRRPRAGSARW